MPNPAPKRKRSCIGCGAQADKTTLLRVVRTPEGAIAFDPGGRAPGRGAYVCSPECFKAASKAKKLQRALKTEIKADVIQGIAEEIGAAAHVEEKG